MDKTLEQREQAKVKVANILQKRLGSKAKGIYPQKLRYDKLIEKIGQQQEPNFKFRKLR